jgi:hypothetical protein
MFALDGPIVHQLVDTFDVDFSRWGPRGAPVERTLPAALPPRTPGTSRGRVLRGWPDARDFYGHAFRRPLPLVAEVYKVDNG